jgi:hypothetical protein
MAAPNKVWAFIVYFLDAPGRPTGNAVLFIGYALPGLRYIYHWLSHAWASLYYFHWLRPA